MKKEQLLAWVKSLSKKYLVRAFAALLVVGLIVYTVYHVIASSTASLMTTPTRPITDLRMLEGEGYWFRDEEVLSSDGTGIVDPLVENGSKVSKNEPVATVWTGYSLAERETAQRELDRLNRMISVLEAGAVSPGTPLTQADVYRQQAGAVYLAIQSAMQAGKWSDLDELSDELLILLNRHGALIGGSHSYESALSDLRAQKRELLGAEGTTVTAEVSSGYFYDRTHVDGYEAQFEAEKLDSLTLEELDSLKSSVPLSYEGKTVLGKMVYSYTRYLVVEMRGDASSFVEGELYELYFSRHEGRTLTMTCHRVLDSEQDRFAVIFKTGDNPAWLSQARITSVEVVAGSTSGYYVPDSALTVLDGVEGVYIFQESTVRFRRVEVLYRGDGYCVVAEQGDRGEDYLALYDILITDGKKLYDGKVY